MTYEFSNNFELETTVCDSGISSFSSDCNDSTCHPSHFNFEYEPNVAPSLEKVNAEMPKGDHIYKIKYLGEQQLSRRHTPYMIPWIVEEIKGNSEEYFVNVSVSKSSRRPEQIVLKVDNEIDQTVCTANQLKQIHFEHQINNLTRFSKSFSVPNLFSYLFRDSPESSFTCFVFDAIEEKVVNNIFYAIHNAMLSSPLSISNESSSPSVSSCDDDSHRFEVIYIGKVVVATKKATPSFIDEAVKKFQELGRWDKLSKDITSCNNVTFDCKVDGVACGENNANGSANNNSGNKTKMTCILESQDEECNVNDETVEQALPGKTSPNNGRERKLSFFNFASSFDSLKLKSLLISRSISVEGEKSYIDQDHNFIGTSLNNNNKINNSDNNNNNNNQCMKEEKSSSILKTHVKDADNDYDKNNISMVNDINLCTSNELHQQQQQQSQLHQQQQSQLDQQQHSQQQQQHTQQQQVQQEHQKTSNKKSLYKPKHSYLVIGRDYLTLWPSQQTQPTHEWKFKNITFCSQGVIYSNHLGFIARSNENNKYTCYIFKCSSESSVDEMMMTIKKAFQDALDRSSRHHVVCELCPMHQMHKLCLLLENKDVRYIHDVLMERITYLEHCYKLSVYYNKKTTYDVPTLHETNVHMVSCLLRLCDKQQQLHSHVNDNKNNNASKFMLYPSELEQENIPFKNKSELSVENNEVVFGSNYSLLSFPAIEDMDHINHNLDSHWKVDGYSNQVKLRRHSVPYTLPVCSKMLPDDVPSSYINLSPMRKKIVMMLNEGDELDGRRLVDGDYVFIDKKIPYDSPIRSMFNKVGSHHGNVLTRNKPYLKQIGKSNSTSSSSSLSSILSPRLSLTSAINNNYNSNISTMQKYRGAWQINVISMMNMKNPNFIDDENVREGLHDDDDENRRFHPRSTWKKAIGDTILLIKINKKNQKNAKDAELEDFEGVGRRVNYQEVTPSLKGVKKLWKQLLDTDLWRTIRLEKEVLIRSVKNGVPKEMRGQIWKLLVHQHKLHHSGSADTNNTITNSNNNTAYDSLNSYTAVDYDVLKNQLTTHQHAILIDLGRTFPNHPYFSSASGPGQASLFNILKAYSVLDVEVGYCQGLSFVAGVLLIHVREKDAFDLLKHIMFELGFRRQYKPDMVPLQIRMYQLTRMLHDSYKDLFDHLDTHQIAPTLYAAPWFLTIFASQFPLGFVARVFDLILMHGTEVIIKVALVLLDNHRELIKQCSTFESLVEFLKVTLPDMAIIQMERIFNQVYSMDITKTLEAYEMEYHILHEEISRPFKTLTQTEDNDKLLSRLTRVQLANDSLRRQKMELLDQLQIARRQIRSLEEENCLLSNSEMKLKSQNQILELERKALLKMIDQLNMEHKMCMNGNEEDNVNNRGDSFL